ncbi:MAG: hypothetical protein ABI183_16795 [Polyangiaceae bacterium]
MTLALACGGSNNKDAVSAHSSTELTADQIDADPIALLPGSAIAIANVDAKAFFGSQSLGPTVADLLQQYFPIGDEAGFVPKRDVDSVVAATYSLQGLDVAAVLKGRFDATKIQAAADKHTPMKSGGALVSSTYSGHAIYTLANIGFTVLTPSTVVAGTEAGMHRVLDRIHDGKHARDITPWMLETLSTKGAAFALAADFATQPITSVAVGNLPAQWVKGLKAVRLVGDFKDSGTEIAGSLTYDTEDNASNGASGAKQLTTMANLASLTGLVPRLDNLDIHTEKTSLQYQFSVDDTALRKLLQNIPSLVQSQ